MRNGDIKFQQIIYGAERAVKQMASCGLSYSAKSVNDLIRYTKAMDKNQKRLIRLILKLQRENKMWNKIGKVMFSYMTDPQKRYVLEYAEGLDDDATRTAPDIN
jgi:hypothetical protein